MQKEIDSVKQVIGNTINQPILKDGRNILVFFGLGIMIMGTIIVWVSFMFILFMSTCSSLLILQLCVEPRPTFCTVNKH